VGNISKPLPQRHLLFFSLCLLILPLCREPLAALLSFAWRDDRYTHLPLIPFISIVLAWFRRARIFVSVTPHPWLGACIAVLGTLVAVLAPGPFPAVDSRLSLAISGVALGWIGCFVGCYGVNALKLAAFPLSLLLLFIPLPASAVEIVQVALQRASADVTHILFRLAGTPVLRQGLVFSLPGIDIEVARECSGIRSTTALLITSLILGHLFLRSGWRKVSFVLLTIPIAIFKNAVRIATLSWLGVYVSRDYLLGQAHHFSGLPVSALGLGLMIPILLLLQRTERPSHRPPAQAPPLTPGPHPAGQTSPQAEN